MRRFFRTPQTVGNPLSTTGTLAGTLGKVNPFRYRGYYYDVETGYYYLQARYYNPGIGRFISADPVLDTNSAVGLNLYAYCGNDPVNNVDPDGDFWHIVVGSVIGGLIGGISAAISGGDLTDIVIGTAAGMLSGALAASGAGLVAQVVGGAVISAASNAGQQINKIVKGEQEEFNYLDMAFDGAVGAVCGRLSGVGASYGNVAGINAAEKHLFKQGISKATLKYFASQAHNAEKAFVYTALGKAMGYSSAGSTVIVAKNAIKERVVKWISQLQ